jgi:hypothetical protein
MAIGITTIAGSAAAEAVGGGAGAVVSGLAGSTLAKTGVSAITLAFAAKWVMIGAVGGLATVGAVTELAGPRASGPSAITPIVSTSRSASGTSDFSGSHRAIARPSAAADHDGDEVAVPPSVAPPFEQRNAPAKSARGDIEANAGHGSSARERIPSRPASAVLSEPHTEPASESGTAGARSTGDRAGLAPQGDVGTEASIPSLRAPSTSEASRAPKSTTSLAQGPSNDDESGRPPVGGSELSPRLNSQVMLIDGAWAAVKRNDPAGALRLLSGYERAFPALDLHPEVMFLRMTAEAALGQMFGARAEATRIVALYPQSVQAKRARELLARP